MYPHVHVILQFSVPISVKDSRYFDAALYRAWRKSWSHGHSDFVPPRFNKSPVFYLMKYISKNTPTYRTLWKRYFEANSTRSDVQNVTVSVSSDQKLINSHVPNTDAPVSTTPIGTVDKFSLTLKMCSLSKVKQLSWSRNYSFTGIPIPAKRGDKQALLSIIPK